MEGDGSVDQIRGGCGGRGGPMGSPSRCILELPFPAQSTEAYRGGYDAEFFQFQGVR